MAKLEFTANNQRLVISNKNNEIGWSSIFIERDDEIIPLGSEAMYIIKQKLIPIIKSINSKETKKYKGINIVPLMNLSEPHASIAASPKSDGGMELYLLDANNNFYQVMQLNSGDVNRFADWLESLS